MGKCPQPISNKIFSRNNSPIRVCPPPTKPEVSLSLPGMMVRPIFAEPLPILPKNKKPVKF